MTTTMKVRGGLAGLGLAVVLAACGGAAAGSGAGDQGVPAPTTAGGASGGSSGAGGSGGASEAEGLCKYVGREQAAAALGEPVDEGDAGKISLTGTYWCRYMALESDSVLDVQYGQETFQTWQEDMDSTGMLDETVIDGLGQKAYRSDDAALGAGTRLAVYDEGASIWVVIVQDGDQDRIYAAAEDLARDLLKQLTS